MKISYHFLLAMSCIIAKKHQKRTYDIEESDLREITVWVIELDCISATLSSIFNDLIPPPVLRHFGFQVLARTVSLFGPSLALLYCYCLQRDPLLYNSTLKKKKCRSVSMDKILCLVY